MSQLYYLRIHSIEMLLFIIIIFWSLPHDLSWLFILFMLIDIMNKFIHHQKAYFFIFVLFVFIYFLIFFIIVYLSFFLPSIALFNRGFVTPTKLVGDVLILIESSLLRFSYVRIRCKSSMFIALGIAKRDRSPYTFGIVVNQTINSIDFSSFFIWFYQHFLFPLISSFSIIHELR